MSSAMNLGGMLPQMACRHGDLPAVLHGSLMLTWRDLDARAAAAAGALRARGVDRGDAVIILCRNSVDMVVGMWAVLRAGGVLVPVNCRLALPEVAYVAQVTNARLLIHDEEFDAISRALLADKAISTVITIRPLADTWPSIAPLIPESISFAPADVAFNSPAWYFFTSGTTGRPKAAVLTHGQLWFVINNHLADLMPDLRPGHLSLALAPLSHGAGLHMFVNAARASGTVISTSASFDASNALQLIAEHHVHNLFAVPTMVRSLAAVPAVDALDLSSLRYLVYAGAPMYRADQVRALEVFGSALVQYYGLVEVTGNITVLPNSEHSPDDAKMKVGSCGFPRTGMEVQIVDPESRQMLAPNQTGEICARGPAVFAGYLSDQAATDRVMRNGWFHTGDVGHLDDKGYLYITGRLSDMYISGGANIYPREIEEQLLEHEDVVEAAVFGVPDPHWGEIGVAIVVVSSDAALEPDDLVAHLRQRIASYKIPRRFEFAADIPKTAYGKVAKSELRLRYTNSRVL